MQLDNKRSNETKIHLHQGMRANARNIRKMKMRCSLKIEA